MCLSCPASATLPVLAVVVACNTCPEKIRELSEHDPVTLSSHIIQR
jgi:hypothetical protein